MRTSAPATASYRLLSTDPGGTFDTAGGEEGDIPFFAQYAIIVVEEANQVDFTFNVYKKELP